MATIKDVAKAAGVSTATVSAVINDTAYVSPELRDRVLAAIRELDYVPSRVARNLRSGRSQLIALAVADLANPFYARIVCAAETAVAAWGYSLVRVQQRREARHREADSRAHPHLGCDGLVMVPVGSPASYRPRELPTAARPIVLLGRSVDDSSHRHGHHRQSSRLAARRRTISWISATRRIGSITGPLHLSTSRGRLQGMQEAMAARGLAPMPEHIRSGEFREDSAYSVARDMLSQAGSANGALCGQRRDGDRRHAGHCRPRVCAAPQDISIASTDTIAGMGGIRPRLTRTEHPVVDMTNEALRMLVDRIKGTPDDPAAISCSSRRWSWATAACRHVRLRHPYRSA